MTHDPNLLSVDVVQSKIEDGDLIVIYQDHALRLNNWVARHPGGDLAILHMVGRDATQEMDVYHAAETISIFKSYSIGRVSLPWKSMLPPIQQIPCYAAVSSDSNSACASKSAIASIASEVSSCKSTCNSVSSSSNGSATATITLTETGLKKETKKTNEPLKEGSSILTCAPVDANTAKVIDEYDSKMCINDQLKYPDLDTKTQANIVDKFRQLHQSLEEQGQFNCNYWGYFRDFCRISTLFALSAFFFSWRYSSSDPSQEPWTKTWLTISATFLGLAWHQLVFIAHDAGHLGITHNFQVDNIVGIIIANYIGGLSLGWWKRNHNVHHIVTNDPVHDPDIQHLPFFAVSAKFLGNIKSTFYNRILWFDAFAKALIPFQDYMYYPILSFGRFNLYRLSWEYLLLGLGPRRGKAAWLRYFELVGLAFFFYWFFYLIVAKSLHSASERWLFVMVSHIVTMPVHVQITLSHFAMSTSDMGMDESFPQRQVRTTMDVDCPKWLDYVHGGLQFQVIHHLFPRMPRHNFREVQPQVIKFCEDLGLHYTIYKFSKGNAKVLSKLGEIAEQAKILAECQKVCKDELLGHSRK